MVICWLKQMRMCICGYCKYHNELCDYELMMSICQIMNIMDIMILFMFELICCEVISC